MMTASAFAYRFEGGLQIIDGNDGQTRESGLASVHLQAEIWNCLRKVESSRDMKGERDDEAATAYAGV